VGKLVGTANKPRVTLIDPRPTPNQRRQHLPVPWMRAVYARAIVRTRMPDLLGAMMLGNPLRNH